MTTIQIMFINTANILTTHCRMYRYMLKLVEPLQRKCSGRVHLCSVMLLLIINQFILLPLHVVEKFLMRKELWSIQTFFQFEINYKFLKMTKTMSSVICQILRKWSKAHQQDHELSLEKSCLRLWKMEN